MNVFVRLVLLALLALSSNAAPEPEECNLETEVTAEGMRTLMGSRWIQVEAFADYEGGVALLSSVSSSVMEMSLNSDKKTFLFHFRSILNGKCLTYYVNMSAPDPETSSQALHMRPPGVQYWHGHVTPYDDHATMRIYQSSTGHHCLAMICNIEIDGSPKRMLLFYRQEPKDQNVEECSTAQHSQRDIATCLDFRVDKYFKYDGKAGFCEKDKEREG